MSLAAAVPPCPDLTVHDLRTQATTLRREAEAIEAALAAIQTCDRPDVWQGGRATAFREGLLDQVQRLSAPASGVTDALRQAAARIEQRADSLAAAPPAAEG